MVEKLEMKTARVSQENIEKIRALFPNAVTEVKKDGRVELAVDFNVLKQELSDTVIEAGQERYQMTWPDKRKAVALANSAISATLRPRKEESVDFDTTKNLYIEGDNLDVLKLLRETYLGKVKMIYIDPPYNTGNDFVYEDDFAQSAEEYTANSGQYDEQGNRLFQNTESNGRFHTDWLNMIYPRLKVARDLLTDDGVIFISIDDNEQANLKKICDEIFGEDNFITSLIWAAGRKNDSKYISVSHEYILCYVRSLQYLVDNGVVWRERKQGLEDIYGEYEKLRKRYGTDYVAMTKALKEWYKSLSDTHPAKNHAHYCYIDEKGIFFPDNASWPGGGGPKYEVLHPFTQKPVKVPTRGWVFSTPERMQEMIKMGLIYFGEDENSVPCIKSYLKDRENSTPYSVFYKDGRAATKRLRNLMGAMVFQNPKDEEIIKSLISFTLTNKNAIVLDFFSGSATTAHAVMQLNAEDGGKRKFIMVQLPEKCDEKSEAYKAGYKNICEIGKERIRRAGKKIKEESPLTTQALDTGFRVLKLDSSNMQDVFYNPSAMTQSLLDSTVDNVKPDRTPLDLLFQVMLELGKPLSARIEEREVDGKKYYAVDGNDLIACFDDDLGNDVITAIAKQKPLYAVFKDKSFATDSVGINNEQLFKTYSPSTVVKVI